MKQSRPPAFAAWLLEHLAFICRNDALAGDLEEEFRHGRSTTWYWRQVGSAIANGLLKQAQAKWPSVLFAALWSAPIPNMWLSFRRSMDIERLLERAAQFDWPWSALGTLPRQDGGYLLLVWVGLVVYLCLHSPPIQKLDLMRLCYGFLTTLPVFVAANAALAFLYWGYPTHGRVAIYMKLTLDPFYFFTRLPLFFSLLLSIWVALPKPRRITTRAAA
jgi:hypothetical protein